MFQKEGHWRQIWTKHVGVCLINCINESLKGLSNSKKDVTYDELIIYLCGKLTPEIFIRLNLGFTFMALKGFIGLDAS